MSWNQSRDLYIDINCSGGADCLLIVDSDAVSRDLTPIKLMQRDAFELRLNFRDDSTGPWATAQLPTGSTVKVAGAAVGALSNLLFSSTNFTESGSGDDLHYAGDLNLNTTEIAAALGSVDSISVLIDVEVQNSANSKRTTYRLSATLTKDIFDNAAGPPTIPGLSSSTGTATLTNGASSVTVNLSGLSLPSAPSQIFLTIRAPSSSADILLPPVVDESSLSTSGFTAYFPATVPATGYKLDWWVVV